MRPSEMTPSGPWLGLSEAACYLGVHFTTLRRWADAGELPCIRTPGGRRRFALSDLENFLARLRQRTSTRALMPLETRVLDLTRHRMQADAVQQEDWFARFDEQQRLQFRQRGQRLLALLFQYSTRSDAGTVFLEEARLMAREYGTACYQTDLSVTETTRVFLFFQRSILDAVHETDCRNGASDVEGQRLYQRLRDFMDTMLLATVQSYCDAQALNAPRPDEGP